MDAAQMKERERASWTRVAPGWVKYDEVLARGAAPLSERMFALAHLAPGKQVLDIACGTGEPAIPAARCVAPGGRVLATDLVEPMVAYAREKAQRLGVDNVEFRCVDGETLDVPAGHFDAVTMRWGLMFMPDPVGCLKHCLRALKPGGRVVLTVWAEPARNPWVATPMGVIRKYVDLPTPPPDAPGIFAFADPNRVRSTMTAGGFRDVEVEPFEVCLAELGSELEVYTMIREMAGPLAGILSQQDATTLAKIERDVIEGLRPLRQGDKVRLTGVTWLASASK